LTPRFTVQTSVVEMLRSSRWASAWRRMRESAAPRMFFSASSLSESNCR
jgi:hypothetical protein